MPLLQNKVAIITGAGSGIGEAIAILYAQEGAQVIVTDVHADEGQTVANKINAAGGKAIFVKADASSAEDNEKVVATAKAQFGGLHIAVNNAGIAGPLSPTGDYPVDGWNKVISVNLSGVFYGLRYQIPAILASGGGSIVNMTSILGMVGTKNSPAYVAAKHGVIGLTKSAALEYADKNIRINCIGPGYILTPLLTNTLDQATLDMIATMHPIGRLGQSIEVAQLSLFLNSDLASFITGSYYNIDGGYLAQ